MMEILQDAGKEVALYHPKHFRSKAFFVPKHFRSKAFSFQTIFVPKHFRSKLFPFRTILPPSYFPFKLFSFRIILPFRYFSPYECPYIRITYALPNITETVARRVISVEILWIKRRILTFHSAYLSIYTIVSRPRPIYGWQKRSQVGVQP